MTCAALHDEVLSRTRWGSNLELCASRQWATGDVAPEDGITLVIMNVERGWCGGQAAAIFNSNKSAHGQVDAERRTWRQSTTISRRFPGISP